MTNVTKLNLDHIADDIRHVTDILKAREEAASQTVTPTGGFDLAAEIRKVDADYLGRLKALRVINKEAMLLIGKGAVMQAFIDALRDANREGATW